MPTFVQFIQDLEKSWHSCTFKIKNKYFVWYTIRYSSLMQSMVIILIIWWKNNMLEEFMPFMGLIIFGNIENLILSSQGVVNGVDPKVLGGLSVLVVIVWLIWGTVLTDMAMQYSNVINFIGGLAIFILGIQAVYGAVKNIRSKGGN